ncbi:MAG: S9 family peptidase [candidate division Zixibacteria bacterium]|nr:S9 family peptidase [candidate division Zixibacteria bacterium]
MKVKDKLLLLGSLVILFALVLGACSQSVKTIPLRDFFKNPEKAYFQISPDGQKVSFTQPFENRMNVFVQTLGSEDVKRLTSVTDRDINEYFWKGNDRILYLKDFGGDENFHLFSVDINGHSEKDLTPYDSVRVQLIDDLYDDPTDVIIGMNKRNRQIFDAYRLNTVSGVTTLVAENPGNITGWLTDHDGKIRLAITTDGVNRSLLYRETEIDKFKEIITTNFKESFFPLFFTFDNKNMFAVSNLGRDKEAIIKYDIAGRKETDVIFEDPEYDVSGLRYSRLRKVLTEVDYVTWKTVRKFLDKETEQLYEVLGQKLPGYDFNITSSNKNEDVFTVRTYSDRSLGSYYVFEKKTGKLTKLAERNPWINENDMAVMKPITYKARDGLTIHGYLTLPVGKEPKTLPVVVNPHGGPWYRDEWGFNPEVQFLANRGFAVLQMNFRGSTGYGKQFWEASFKEWGRKMQDDITDGVQWLIKEGIADPERIAIYGGSYGGYATLAGVCFTPDLYACAVDYVGVSNLFTFMNTIPPYWKPFLDMMHEMVGDPTKDSAMLAATSPVFHVDKIKAPLFVAQGAKDPRVNIDESNQIVEALKARGVAVEYMVKDNEGHGFANEENRFDFYEAMEKFLSTHLSDKK